VRNRAAHTSHFAPLTSPSGCFPDALFGDVGFGADEKVFVLVNDQSGFLKLLGFQLRAVGEDFFLVHFGIGITDVGGAPIEVFEAQTDFTEGVFGADFITRGGVSSKPTVARREGRGNFFSGNKAARFFWQ